MNKIYSFALSALFLSFIACNKEEVVQNVEISSPQTRTLPTILQDPAQILFEVVDGYLKFQTVDDYLSTYTSLDGKSKHELLAWSEENGYFSMLKQYREEDSIACAAFVPDHDFEPGDKLVDDSERVLDIQLATLFNNEGMVFIGDTIYKLHGKYVYRVLETDYATLEEIDNATDVESLDYIPHHQHTMRLDIPPMPPLALDGPMRVNYTSRSTIINVSSKRREFVDFTGQITAVTPLQNRFKAYMTGQAQTKSLGIWWPNFDDEIVSGSVRNDVYTRGAYNNGEALLTLVAWTLSSGTNVETIEVAPYYCYGNFRFIVTYTFVKHASRGQESYTKTYDMVL